MIKKINQIILILIALIIFSCEELSNEPDPIWGCRDTNACNYNPLADYDDDTIADYEDDCIYPESYDECCYGQILDDCGICNGDGSTCFTLEYINSFQYADTECSGDSSRILYADIEFSIVDHTNLVQTGTSKCNLVDSTNFSFSSFECESADGNWIPNIIYSEVDSVIDQNTDDIFQMDSLMILLRNFIILDGDTIHSPSQLVFDDNQNNDTLFISMMSENEYGCEKTNYFSTDNIFIGSMDINKSCCNYNQFALVEMDCYSLDCDGICNGANIPDCNNDCEGIATIDECGECCGGNTSTECSFYENEGNFGGAYDCLGECNGLGVIDWLNSECCNYNELDCEGVCNGNAFEDSNENCCEYCIEDGSNLETCETSACDICSNFTDSLFTEEQWDTLWVDYFSDENINSDNWNLEYWEPGRYNNELQAYTPRSENVYIESGNLVIKALREDYTYIDYNTGAEIPAQYTSARLNTKLKVDFNPINCGPNQGGEIRVDVRAKLPGGDGTWPAIWLLPTYSSYGQWPISGEIDIMEHGPGTTGENVIVSSVHTQAFNFNVPGYFESGSTNSAFINNATSEYKVYSLIWSVDSIIISVDGEEILDFENVCDGYTTWPFSESFHILINLAIGGHMGGTNFDNDVFPQFFSIDYVSVTQNTCYSNN